MRWSPYSWQKLIVIVISTTAFQCPSGAVSFVTGKTFPTGGPNPVAFVVGDFNNDGKPDIVVANDGEPDNVGNFRHSNITLLLGNGDASFPARITIPIGNPIYALVSGDFNKDGNLDLAVVERTTQTQVTVLYGDGRGRFHLVQQIPIIDVIPISPVALATGDMNHDGNLDLVIAGVNPSDLSSRICVLFGRQDGSFVSPCIVSSTGSQFSGQALISDVNGDGILDVITPSFTLTGSTELIVALGMSNGTFKASSTLCETCGIGDGAIVVAADVNGDGKADLVVSSGSPCCGISVLLGDGGGSFLPPINIPLEGVVSGMAVSDLDGDGAPDIAVLAQDGRFIPLFNDGSGHFTHEQESYEGLPGFGTIPIVVADVNGDRKSDVLLLGAGSFGKILLNLGSRKFWAARALKLGTIPNCNIDLATMADVNGDGTPDMILHLTPGEDGYSCLSPDPQKTIAVVLGNPEGTFQTPKFYSGPAATGALVVADFNGDGKLDLATTDVNSSVFALLGNGDGSFQPQLSSPAGPSPTGLALGDFNADGKPDLAATNFLPGTVTILLGKGDGRFTKGETISTGLFPGSVLSGQIIHKGGNDRHEGGSDLSVVNCGSGQCQTVSDNGSITLLSGTGASSFGTLLNLSVCNSPTSVFIADINHDGNSDLLINCFNGAGPPSIILLGNGDGTFQTPVPLRSPVALLGDLNKDGHLDIISTNVDGTLDLLAGRGDGSFSPPVQLFQGLFGAYAIFLEDVNGDEAPDLIVSEQNYILTLLNASGTRVALSVPQAQSATESVISANVMPTINEAGIPTGTISFSDMSAFPTKVLGMPTLVKGRTSIVLSDLSPGMHVIRAAYSGDRNFASSMSSDFSVYISGGAATSGSKSVANPGTNAACEISSTRDSSTNATAKPNNEMRPLKFTGTGTLQTEVHDSSATSPFVSEFRRRTEFGKPFDYSSPRGIEMRRARIPKQQQILSSTKASGFDALDHADSRAADNGSQISVEPPDQALSASSTQVFEAVNDVVAVYEKDGQRVGGPTSLNKFFHLPSSEVHGSTSLFGPFVTDPRAIYDFDTKRWFVTALKVDTDPANGDFVPHSELLIAVSDTPDAAGSYAQYSINITDEASVGCPCLGDQPLLGINRDGLYVGTDEFSFADQSFQAVLLIAIDKEALAQHRVLYAASLKPEIQAEMNAFAVQPAIMNQAQDARPNNGTEYLMNSLDFSHFSDNRLTIWAITDTATLHTSTPALRIFNRTFETETYGPPPPVPQKNGPAPLEISLNAAGGHESIEMLDTGDDRLQQVYAARGKLFTTMGTRLPGSNYSGVAWFVIKPSADSCGVTARLEQQGYIAAARLGLMFPAIAVNKTGAGVISFSMAGPGRYPSSAYSVLGPDGLHGIHIAAPGVFPEDGFSGYKALGGDGTARWGDYSAAAVDPSGDLWFASEYIPNRPRTPLANWGTFIAHIKFDRSGNESTASGEASEP